MGLSAVLLAALLWPTPPPPQPLPRIVEVIKGDPDFDFTALVRATSRRFLITLGDPKNADARWTFDAEARRLDVAR